MKIPALKRLNPEDFPGLPESFGPVLEAINDNMDTVFKALREGLDREANLGQERVALKVRNGEAEDITLKQIKGRARLAQAFVGTLDTFKVASINVQPGVMRVVVTFDVAPATDQEVEFFFEAVP